jgi:hypothetical protein
MTATLADLRELTRPPSAFAAFQGHFLSTFMTTFNEGFCCCSGNRLFFASWAANKALNLLRASSLEFNASFFLEAGGIKLTD